MHMPGFIGSLRYANYSNQASVMGIFNCQAEPCFREVAESTLNRLD